MSPFPTTPRWQQRLKGYWFTDGLADSVTGAAFLAYALLQTLSLCCPAPYRPWSWAAAASLVVVIAAGRAIVTRLKWRITYPRTGYIAYPRTRRFSPRAAMLAAVIFALACFLPAGAVSTIALGAGVAAVLVFIALTFGLPRYGIYAAVALAATAASLYGLPRCTGWRLQALQNGLGIAAAVGFAMLAGGLLVFSRYVHAHPAPTEDARDL